MVIIGHLVLNGCIEDAQSCVSSTDAPVDKVLDSLTAGRNLEDNSFQKLQELCTTKALLVWLSFTVLIEQIIYLRNAPVFYILARISEQSNIDLINLPLKVLEFIFGLLQESFHYLFAYLAFRCSHLLL